MRYVLAIVGTLAVVVLLLVVLPFTGLYNVAATSGHTGLVEWYLETLAERSIEVRAGDASAPFDLTDSTRVARGAVAFRDMCVVCHGAPGRDRGVIGQGMTPRPPRLSRAATEWSPGEVHWILAHGIKMAGMPAFGPTHTEEQLWEIVAFVEQLPDMTPERYHTLTTPAADTTDTSDTSGAPADDGHGHDHVH